MDDARGFSPMAEAESGEAESGEADSGEAVAGAAPYIDAIGVESFEVFFALEYRRLVAFGRALTGDGATAEDLAQDAMWSAHQRWSRLVRLENPAAWVRRAVANRAVSRLRHLAAEARALARLSRRADAEAAEGPEAFWAAVRALPARQAQVVALRYLEDYSTAEIASVLACAEPTVRVHLARARATLARRLSLEWEGGA